MPARRGERSTRFSAAASSPWGTASSPPSFETTPKFKNQQQRQQQQQTPYDLFHKTRICRFNELGLCAKGLTCSFAHSKGELAPMPDLTKTRICQELIDTGSCTKQNCAFAHSKRELRQRPSKKSLLAARAAAAAALSPPAREKSKQEVPHSLGVTPPPPPPPTYFVPVPQEVLMAGSRQAERIMGDMVAMMRSFQDQESDKENPPSLPPSSEAVWRSRCRSQADSEDSTTGGESTPRESRQPTNVKVGDVSPTGNYESAFEVDDDQLNGDECEMEIGVKNTFVHVTPCEPGTLRRVRSWSSGSSF